MNYDDPTTVLGQYNLYLYDPDNYAPTREPSCHAMNILDVLDAHPSYRLDPKFHLFNLERIQDPPPHMVEYRLGDLLVRREEQVDPRDYPDDEFLTLTLSQDGVLSPREAGKGHNPPSWHGAYFSGSSRWYRAYAGDLIYSQIDLWKGCVAVIPPEYDQAIVTQEFPLYRIVDSNILTPEYLALLLRSRYFQRAIRAITTGHSNRRRTQQDDFENLKVFLPKVDIQRKITAVVEKARQQVQNARNDYMEILSRVEDVIVGKAPPTDFT